MKLFSKRSLLKEKIHSTFKKKLENDIFYINQKEVWFVNLGINIGFEEDGKWYDDAECRRPVIVLKKLGNLYRVAPLTSIPKNPDKPYYFVIPNDQLFYHKDSAKTDSSCIILSQVRVLDKSRFIYKAAELHHIGFSEAIKKLKILLF